jgi:hypothetical protein
LGHRTVLATESSHAKISNLDKRAQRKTKPMNEHVVSGPRSAHRNARSEVSRIPPAIDCSSLLLLLLI